jgi:hypothetical protein
MCLWCCWEDSLSLSLDENDLMEFIWQDLDSECVGGDIDFQMIC